MILGLSFVSCKNFLNANEVRNEIENHIAYANSSSYLIKVDYTRNTGIVKSPAGAEAEKKVTDVFQVCFEPATDYEFIYWKIIDSATKKEYQNGEYLELASLTDAETTCTFKKAPEQGMNLCLYAVVAERPQIISYTPITSNTYKDSTIQVMFDFDMDEASLYYTTAEMEELIKEGIADEGTLAETLNGKTIYRAYKKNGARYYKNVFIKNNKSSKNLNAFFNPPVIENKNTISITADKKNMVDSYSQILVTIEKGMFYTVKVDENITKNVEMAGSKKWMYQVSGKGDGDALVVSQENDEDLFEVKINNDEDVEQEASHTVSNSTGTGINTLKYLQNDKLKLNLQVNDINNGSGPASTFKLFLKRIYNENYAAVSEDEEEHKLDFQVYTSELATFEDTLDLSEWGITDGVYEMYFTFKDRSENTLTYPANNKKYYFARDKVKPDFKNLSMSSNNNTTHTITWATSIPDIESIQYSVKVNEETPDVTNLEGSDRSATVENIAINTKYEIKVLLKDYAGNETEATVPRFLTGYLLEGTPSFTGTNASHVNNVFFVNDYISYYGLSLKKYYSDGSSVDDTSGKKIPTKSSYNSSSKLSYSVTENGVTKTASTSSSYYTAKKDSLTQTISKYSYDGTHGTSASYYKFGDWPQSIKSSSVTVSSNTVYNDWYLGSDGYFYARCAANPCDTKKCDDMSDGTSITAGNYYYFKVEPIIWRRLGTADMLLAEKVLDGSIKWYNGSGNRTISGKTIYPNNYKYSTIRAFLNGSYESGDNQTQEYSGAGFYQKAFTSTARSKLSQKTVINTAVSTNPSNNSSYWNSGNNSYACDDTNDYVFLLSENSLTKPSFTFPSSNYTDKTTERYLNCTDYAKARHVYQSQYTDYAANWWTRSPWYDDGSCARYVNTGGTCNSAANVMTIDNIGIAPVIYVSSLP